MRRRSGSACAVCALYSDIRPAVEGVGEEVASFSILRLSLVCCALAAGKTHPPEICYLFTNHVHGHLQLTQMTLYSLHSLSKLTPRLRTCLAHCAHLRPAHVVPQCAPPPPIDELRPDRDLYQPIQIGRQCGEQCVLMCEGGMRRGCEQGPGGGKLQEGAGEGGKGGGEGSRLGVDPGEKLGR